MNSQSSHSVPRIAFTPGEPAGIGPELTAALTGCPLRAQVVVIGSCELLSARAACTGRHGLDLPPYDPAQPAEPGIRVLDIPLDVPSKPGVLDPRNAHYVLSCLDRACDGCLAGEFDALVTGPVSKAVLDTPDRRFTGHTEYLQQRSGVPRVVMMLGCRAMRVALCTTHLPLSAVPGAITGELIEDVVRILHHDLQRRFGIADPLIVAAGLNPHAGEDGHLGREETDIIIPVLSRLRDEGINITGPLPADTMFQPKYLNTAAAFLCMYHDQGLPVLKYAGFEQGYNVTLGLPFIRVSVDHGTALDLAGTGRASAGSLLEAMNLAVSMTGYSK